MVHLRGELLPGGNQPDDLLHTGAVKVLAGIHAGSDFELSEGLFVLVKSHQAGGEGIVIRGAGLEAEGLAELLLSHLQLLGINKGGAEIVVGQPDSGLSKTALRSPSTASRSFPVRR